VRMLPEKPALLVLDFDGVLTDDHVSVSEDGREMVACTRGCIRGAEPSIDQSRCGLEGPERPERPRRGVYVSYAPTRFIS
jgi:hypothetical protein